MNTLSRRQFVQPPAAFGDAAVTPPGLAQNTSNVGFPHSLTGTIAMAIAEASIVDVARIQASLTI
jgi:hypothetical protein